MLTAFVGEGGQTAADGGVGNSRSEGRAWAGFSRLLVATGAGICLALLAFLLAVDPYDTGRTGLFKSGGVPEQLPYSANASRGRDLRFDAAIVGNSHVQALRPERLDAGTGLHFVSLMMPGSMPGDQLAMWRWFVDHHPAARAIILGADRPWCLPTITWSDHLPLWLYAPGFRHYLAGLVQYRSLEAAFTRLRLLAGTKPRRARPDGYWDYEPIYREMGLADPVVSRRRLAETRGPSINAEGRFPAIEQFRALLADVPPTTRVVLVRPPIFHTALPEPGTAAARSEEACRAAFVSLVEGRANTQLLDLMHDGPDAREPLNFYDHDHYVDALAVRIEREVAAVLADGSAGGR